MVSQMQERSWLRWRIALHKIIFEADTPAGKAYDVALIWSVILSVTTVVLESVSRVRGAYGGVLHALEWGFTILFTVEYGLRLLCVQRPLTYATSFFGVVDLLAVIPTYVSVLVPGSQYLLSIRILRLLRIFRIFKLTEYLSEASVIRSALLASRPKISVFLFAVMTVVVIIGSVMYAIEGEEHGFSDTPTSIYWAIVTITTVGYGDISPQTALGKALASVVMIMGYSMLAVPTGIVTVELSQASRRGINPHACLACGAEGHDLDAVHCKYCGVRLLKRISRRRSERASGAPNRWWLAANCATFRVRST